MTRYLGPDNGSAYVWYADGRPAPGVVAEVFSDREGTVLADILEYQAGAPDVPGDPADFVVTDPHGRLNFWFPDEQPVVWVSVNGGPLVRVTADLQDQLNDAVIGGGGGGGITIGQVDVRIATHNADTTAVHGIADTTALATDVDVDAAIAVHNATTTSVHGIDDASALETTVGAQGKVTVHAGAADPHGDRAFATAGLAGKAALAHAAAHAVGGADTINASYPSWLDVEVPGGIASLDGAGKLKTSELPALTKAMVGLANADNTSDAGKPVSTATQTALDAKADLVGGLVPTAQIPALAITEVFTVASQAAMLALTAQRGDLAIRTDTGHRFVLAADAPTVLANWVDLGAATDAVSSVNGQTGIVVLGKADVGLSAVDNTSDAAKPVSTATQTALNLKAPLASPAFTGTPTGITKAHVGLGNVDNTTDAAKPVSTAQQTALNLKADLASPTFTGTVSGITKTMVGLGNVDNTADTAKPVSTAQQTALDLKVDKATLTTKGDLYVATAAGTIVRLPVGANTEVLTADSAQTAGVKWAASAGGGGSGLAFPGAINPKANRWAVIPQGRANINMNPVLNSLYLVPLPMAAARTLTGIAIDIATAAGAGGLVRAMVLSSAADWDPSTALADFGTVASDATGIRPWTVSQALSANALYWVGFSFTVSITGLAVRSVETYTPYVSIAGASAPSIGTTAFGAYQMTGVTGALGATPFTYAGVELSPRVQLRFS